MGTLIFVTGVLFAIASIVAGRRGPETRALKVVPGYLRADYGWAGGG